MARLVGICRDSNGNENEETFRKHQLPIFVEDMRTMIVEFEDPSTFNGRNLSKSSIAPKTNLKQFREKVSSLNKDELCSALTVECESFNNTLLQLVPCVGCRRSVEKLYGELSTMRHPAVYPLTISPTFSLTLPNSFITDVKLMHRLFVSDERKLRQTIENLTKYRKNNKRCALHSLDVHVCRSKMSWEELWDLMSEDCRDECCVVETDSLLDMLETYLDKHKFCTECRAKVMKAYDLLVSDGDKSQEKGYNPLAYQGLRYCSSEQHLHVKPSVQYLNALIDRAEPELMGGRERHAKTLDVAQGEVLTCLGLYMYDRLHRLVMALKTLQTTFQLLFCTGVIGLRTKFEEALERKHGLSDSLERLCAELQDSAANPQKQHQSMMNGQSGVGKKGKNKPAKSASASSVSKAVLSKVLLETGNECTNCVRRKSTAGNDSPRLRQQTVKSSRPSPMLRQRSCSLTRGSSITASSETRSTTPSSNGSISGDTDAICNGREHEGNVRPVEDAGQRSGRKKPTGRYDDGCSSGSSCCHDGGYCSQELSPGGRSPAAETHPSSNKQRQMLTTISDYPMNEGRVDNGQLDLCGRDGYCSCTLLNMLQEDKENGCNSTEESLISPEDVKWFHENQTLVSDKRRALRERLLRQFRDMQERMQGGRGKP